MSGAAPEDMTGGVDTDAAVASLRAVLQSPVDSENDNDNDAARQPPPQPPTSSSSPPTDALAQVMQLLTTLITQMPANIAAAVKVDKPSTHLDNAKLDHRNFTRIQNFTNKHSDWREWKNHFIYAVAECDNSFATTLTGMEKGDKPILMVDLNPTQSQLSAVLFNRLQAVTTSTANTMVLSAEGNGCEAWRLLNTFYDPQTDQRLTKSIMDVINFKIKGKEIQSGIIEWEQLVSSLTKDHAIKLDAKLLRAFLMNILPAWMYGKILEHLDRLPTYAEVREKVISLSQSQTGETIQQVETHPTTWGPTEYDEASGYNWQWVDGPVGLTSRPRQLKEYQTSMPLPGAATTAVGQATSPAIVLHLKRSQEAKHRKVEAKGRQAKQVKQARVATQDGALPAINLDTHQKPAGSPIHISKRARRCNLSMKKEQKCQCNSSSCLPSR